MTLNVTLFVLAIATAGEQCTDPHAIGKLGERSIYQFREETWNEVANMPGAIAGSGDFAKDAADPVIARSRAEAWAIHLSRQLENAGVPVTIENLAVAWNSGARAAINRALNGKSPTAYAKRVGEFYDAEAAKIPPIGQEQPPEYLREIVEKLRKMEANK